jgi:hypothetical protein
LVTETPPREGQDWVTLPTHRITTLGPAITASTDRLLHLQRFQAAIRKAGPTKPGQLVSNLTHYSPADPEARIAFKTGKPRILSYLASVGVDVARQVIMHIHADLADWRDSRYLLAIVAATQQRLQTFGLACPVLWRMRGIARAKTTNN